MRLSETLKQSRYLPAAMALSAALLFGLSAPLAKLLLSGLSPMFMVAFLYLGSGIGMIFIHLFSREGKTEAPLSRNEAPWTISMILLDVIAPFLLMLGLKHTTAANASLLLNFEMVATAVIAWLCFHESIGKRMWLSLGVITASGILLSMDFSNSETWHFSHGSLLVIAACGCWGMENNCTRNMSAKSPAEIVIVKGFGSGLTALACALLLEDPFPNSLGLIAATLFLGFIAYGMSIFLYVKAQRQLGAARTSAYYAAAPFMGVLLSMGILHELPSWSFAGAALLMLIGVFLSFTEGHSHPHFHEPLVHNHAHRHDDGHHPQEHNPPVTGWHTHEHFHPAICHEHPHTPDIHHRHQHC